jgi:hypothetical protein
MAAWTTRFIEGLRWTYRQWPSVYTYPVMSMFVSGSNPSRTGVRRLFPPARLPAVGIAIPVVVSANPDMIPAWTSSTMLPNTDRWAEPYDDLRMGGD